MSDSLLYYNSLPESIIRKSTDSNTYKYWKIFADEMNATRLVIDDLRLAADITTRTGVALDNIGLIVRERRGGKTDTNYKVFLNVAIIKGLSRGTIPEITAVAAIVLGSIFKYVRENWTTPSARSYDGTWQFDGTNKLDGLAEVSGNVEIVVDWFDDAIDTTSAALVTDFNYILETLLQVKGAGIHARVLKESRPQALLYDGSATYDGTEIY